MIKEFQRARALTRRLTLLADQVEGKAKDDGCVLLASVLRDSAYKVRRELEREEQNHQVRSLMGKVK